MFTVSDTRFFLTLFGLALVAAVGFLSINHLLQQQTAPVVVTPPERQEEQTVSDYKGRLYMTLAAAGTREFSLYTLHMPSGIVASALEYAYPDDYMGYTTDFEEATGELAYFWSPIDRSLDTFFPFDDPMQLITFPTADPESWLQWATGPQFVKMNPDQTADGTQIVYEAFEDNSRTDPLEEIGSWGLYISTRPEGIQVDEGTASRIDTGSFAHWLEDDKHILYLKADGVYVYNTETEESERVFPLEYSVTRASQLDVSEDGSHFVLTQEGNSAGVYRIASLSPFEYEEVERFSFADTKIFWPVLSPWNDAIAFVESVQRREFTYPDIHITTYNLETGETERHFTVAGPYNPRYHFLTEWRR